MNEAEIKSRLIDVEMALDNQAKVIDDLNEMVIKQQEYLKNILSTDVVRPQSEETPPPHY